MRCSFKWIILTSCALVVTDCAMSDADAQVGDPFAVAVPATAGPVVGASFNSDEYIWRVLMRIVASDPAAQGRAVFESWALNEELYDNASPVWPGRSTLGAASISCSTPRNPWIGGFPLKGCIAEHILRNRPQFDYIVANRLHSREGLADFFKKGRPVDMPVESISLKLNWAPVDVLREWSPRPRSLEEVRSDYYVMRSAGVEYGLVALHVATKANPEWVWSTFEHQDNPGRCDTTGCFDSFGAASPVILPRQDAHNADYAACEKSHALATMMKSAGLDAVWTRYCLRGTQVTFVSASGAPTLLGNSITERVAVNVPMQASSCISCHAYASFGPEGASTEAARAMFHYGPIGKTVKSVLEGSLTYDYMWSVRNVASEKK